MQSSRVCGDDCEFNILYCFNTLNILFRWLVLSNAPPNTLHIFSHPTPSADSDSENSNTDDEVDPDVDPSQRPWLKPLTELNRYLNTYDVVTPGITMVEWCGGKRLPHLQPLSSSLTYFTAKLPPLFHQGLTRP